MMKTTKEKLLKIESLQKLINWLNDEYGIKALKKNPKIASVFVIGGASTNESYPPADIDIEIVFYDEIYTDFTTVNKIREYAKSLADDLDIFVEKVDDYLKGHFVSKGRNKYCSTILLYREVATGVTIAGEDILCKVNLPPIPPEERYGYFSTAMGFFYDGKFAKSVLVAAQVLLLENPKVKDFSSYKIVVDKMRDIVDEQNYAVLEKAYAAKIGKGQVTKEEAESFLNMVNSILLQKL